MMRKRVMAAAGAAAALALALVAPAASASSGPPLPVSTNGESQPAGFAESAQSEKRADR